MDHYVDIRLQPDAEFSPATLMAALFTKLHKALVVGAHVNVGVSFPYMDTYTDTHIERDMPDAQQAPRMSRASRTGAHPRYRLGHVLRLHSTAPVLQGLLASEWLSGMRDHVLCGAVSLVPTGASHRVLSRVQAKSSPERLRRRQMRRHGLSPEQAQARIPDSTAEMLDLPFLTMRSQSTRQTFRLFMRLGTAQASPVSGEFGAYGLSPQTTVPWF